MCIRDRYYWLKLQVGFFQELIIKQLRTLPEGDSIVLLYLKLLLNAINTEGQYESCSSLFFAVFPDK